MNDFCCRMSETLLFFLMLCSLLLMWGCSPEPATTEECLETYLHNLQNDKAAPEIERACQELFDGDARDDRYYACVLKYLPDAATDKDINIILRRCTIDK